MKSILDESVFFPVEQYPRQQEEQFPSSGNPCFVPNSVTASTSVNANLVADLYGPLKKLGGDFMRRLCSTWANPAQANFYLGQFYLGQVLLGPILLRPILLRPGLVLCVVCCVLCVVCCVLCVVCCVLCVVCCVLLLCVFVCCCLNPKP